MQPPLVRSESREVPAYLARLLGVRPEEVKAHQQLGRRHLAGSERPTADLFLETPLGNFVVEFKRNAGVGHVDAALHQLRKLRQESARRATPLLVVPYMGETGKRLCEEAGISWFDLSGNADIRRPGLHVRIEGKPNQFKHAGRPSSLFAPKSSRIVRWLLINPQRSFSQRELAKETGIDEGFTSRIVRRLEREEFIVRDDQGSVKARKPSILLDAWREVYDFSRHHVVRGLVAARSGDELLRRVADTLSSRHLDYAMTGLGAAWLFSKFAAFRTVTLFVRSLPPPEGQRLLGFREEPSGANVWFVVPNDEGVFQGSLDREGVRCAHPVQVFLDLKAQPERATEAADRLRELLLNWDADA